MESGAWGHGSTSKQQGQDKIHLDGEEWPLLGEESVAQLQEVQRKKLLKKGFQNQQKKGEMENEIFEVGRHLSSQMKKLQLLGAVERCGTKETVTVQQRTSPGPSTSTLSSIASRPVPARQKATFAVQKMETNLLKTNKVPKRRKNPINNSNNKWTIVDYVSDESSISKEEAHNLVLLFKRNNTIPFITRYCRRHTGGMNEDELRPALRSYEQASLIKARALAIVRDIDEKDVWTQEFDELVHETRSLHDLAYIHSIFTGREVKIPCEMVELSFLEELEYVADGCLRDNPPPLADLVRESVKGLKTEEQVKYVLISLLANFILKDTRTFKLIKKLRSTFKFEIQTTRGEGSNSIKKRDECFAPYYNFTSNHRDITPDDVQFINEGEALKALSVKINIPGEFQRVFEEQWLMLNESIGNPPPQPGGLTMAALHLAYHRSIKGFVAESVRNEINAKAEKADVIRIAEELEEYLLEPPLGNVKVLGICPGFDNGCTFAVLCELGNVLETGKIFPNNRNKRKNKIEAERILSHLIRKHECSIIALGNGNASSETKVFLTNMINQNEEIPSDVFYTVVDQPSADLYSCSPVAALEFPDVEAEILVAISLARRLQDPMAELVKIEPEQLTTKKHEQEMYRQVVSELVSYVGVDVNVASVSLLKYVSGLNEAKATSIIKHRELSGPYTNRNDLLEVEGISRKTFEQCAGFIRIVRETAARKIFPDTIRVQMFNYLDQTCIHPDSYRIAKSILASADCHVLHLGTTLFRSVISLFAQTEAGVLAKRFNTTEDDIEFILESLMIEKGQDVRGLKDSRMFRKKSMRNTD